MSESYLPLSPIRSAEILCVGTELLLGDIVNTNAAFLSKRLAALGISVYHQTVVGDHPDRLKAALEDAYGGCGRPAADLVIMSGGLGPTYDDLTKETVAAFFGRSMEVDEESLRRIKDYFTRTGRVMSPNNAKQANMPVGATVFPNDYGTAPALAVSDGHRTAILLPGPPGELEPLFDQQVTPYLRRYTEGILVSRNVHLIGIGESDLENRLKDLMINAQNPTVAPYCQSGEVRLRVTAKAHSREEATAMCDCMIDTIKATDAAPFIYGVDLSGIQQAVVQHLTERGMTVGCAESCTGGMIAQMLTDVSGASAVFKGGFVTYTNEMKMKLLGVQADTIDRYTEVSEQTVKEMAEGARLALGTDFAVSTTGYAGPGGGTAENPVGTVYVGIASKDDTTSLRLSYSGTKSRDYIRTAATRRALMELLKVIRKA